MPMHIKRKLLGRLAIQKAWNELQKQGADVVVSYLEKGFTESGAQMCDYELGTKLAAIELLKEKGIMEITHLFTHRYDNGNLECMGFQSKTDETAAEKYLTEA